MGTHPATFKGPPADIASRELPVTLFEDVLYRVHRSKHKPIFPSHNQARFSSPGLPFGVCYAALSLVGAFAETLVDEFPGATFAASSSLVLEHSYSPIVVSSALELVDLTGNKLGSIGTTHLINSTDRYDLTQEWAAAFYRHRQQPDGVLYVANLAGHEISVAIYDRALRKLSAGSPTPFALDSTLNGILNALGVLLI